MATAMQGPEVQRLTRPPGGATSQPRTERLAPLVGIPVMLLGLAGLIVWRVPPTALSGTRPAA